MKLKETYEFLRFIIQVAKGGLAAGADGKVTIADYPAMMPAIMSAPDAFTGMGLIAAEYKGATDEDRIALHQQIAVEFDIPNDRVEILIEKSLFYGGGLFVTISEYLESKEVA